MEVMMEDGQSPHPRATNMTHTSPRIFHQVDRLESLRVTGNTMPPRDPDEDEEDEEEEETGRRPPCARAGRR